ncbi:hypothetical protein ASG12_15785 [Williamsia sp. Leaf354]|uniref:DUF3887 domain-containing protein n=1 Tax=Williamsia sp. Leaf354 TaxID=1736349 RepID=UPI0006F2B28D|nr:DUF3887 domain-containing protein [Williamsia sp. Leaf354]KQR97395.1 hypothetical protein ASG12_15785 [Williamsia sp. Leaf354]
MLLEPEPGDDVVARLRSATAVIAGTLASDSAAAEPMSAVAATDALQSALDEARQQTVARARAAGHTWAEIGSLLRISRQAAQQRFGKSAPASELQADDIIARTRQIAHQFVEHDFAAVRADWSPTLLASVDAATLEQIWSGVERDGGTVRTLGRPTVTVRGPYRSVDMPLALHYGPIWLSVSFAHDNTIAGLWLRYTAPTPAE